MSQQYPQHLQNPQHRLEKNEKDTDVTSPLISPENSKMAGRSSRHHSTNSLSGAITVNTGMTYPTTSTDQSNKNSFPPSILNRTPNSSHPSSRAPSPGVSDMSDDLPNNVSTEEQLLQLPEECLSGNPSRPLQHFGEDGDVSSYALNPMIYSVCFILIVELLERFSFYGINYTQTSYLTGEYDENWNADMASVAASSYVSVSVAVAYTTPFLGAFFADSIFGDYYTIIVGTICFYLPGLSLIACTTIPGFLGENFNKSALAFGLLFLWPVGTGIVKSVVNVFGAKQFHPLLQAAAIEAYYVNFYMCINVGALIGGILVPVLAQHNVTVAYFLPVCMLSVGILIFLFGSPRYVRSKPKRSQLSKKTHKLSSATNDQSPLSAITRVSLLIVPFNIAYSQMGTTFILQGNIMRKEFGWIDAATMNNADAVAVLIFGYIIGSFFYPWLVARGIKIPTTYKFAIGSGLGALAIACALIVDTMIHTTYNGTGEKISIMWQVPSYVLIGIGEIFAVSSAYEVAFTASPPENKVLCSAVNLFCIGGLPNVICIALYQLCRPWFMNSKGTTSINHIHDYASARVDKYYWLLLFICLIGVVINLLPKVKEFVEGIEEKAADVIKTPKTPMRPPRRDPIEEEEHLKSKRHQYYLKYGSGPSLYKSGSLRAGPTLKSTSSKAVNEPSKRLKKAMLSKLYRSEAIIPNYPNIFVSKDGKPVKAGNMPRNKPMARDDNSIL